MQITPFYAALSGDLDKVDGRSSAESPSVGCTIPTRVTMAPRGYSWHGDRLQRDEDGTLFESAESPSVGCTLKRGSLVVKSGVEYRIASVTKKGVVTLNHKCGGFAMYSHINACKQLELSL